MMGVVYSVSSWLMIRLLMMEMFSGMCSLVLLLLLMVSGIVL